MDVKPTITVEKRSGDWIAYLNGDRKVWDAGKTQGEAIGNLVVTVGLVVIEHVLATGPVAPVYCRHNGTYTTHIINDTGLVYCDKCYLQVPHGTKLHLPPRDFRHKLVAQVMADEAAERLKR